MPNVDPTAVFVAILSFVGSYFAYRQATKANRASEKNAQAKLESEAYDRAKSIYESSLTEQEQRIQRSLRETEQLQTIVERIGGQLRDEQRQVTALKADLRDVRNKQQELLELLRNAGVQIPDHLLS